MKTKNIIISTIACGLLLLVLSFAMDFIAQLIAPYSIFDIGGMRAIDDPIMSFYFLYPFVFALMAAIVFDMVGDSIKGPTEGHRGMIFGLILFLLVIIPNMWVIFSTMTYPAGFYVSNLLVGIIAFPLMGFLYVKIWEKC